MVEMWNLLKCIGIGVGFIALGPLVLAFADDEIWE
jgi:hypothetical protein